MVQGVSVVWLPVTDIGRAVGFYGDTLGLQVRSQQDQWAELESGGVTIGLNGRDEETPAGEGGAVVAFRPTGSLEDDGADPARGARGVVGDQGVRGQVVVDQGRLVRGGQHAVAQAHWPELHGREQGGEGGCRHGARHCRRWRISCAARPPSSTGRALHL